MSARDSLPHLTWSDSIGKRIRTGEWQDQATSTSVAITRAISSRQWERAAQLLDYWMEEAKVVYVV